MPVSLHTGAVSRSNFSSNQNNSGMDSYARKPDREGALTHMRSMKKKHKLETQNAFQNSRMKKQRSKPVLKELSIKQAYQERFGGRDKDSLIEHILTLDSAQLQQMCREYSIKIPLDERSSSMTVRQVFTYLERFEAEAITKAQQEDTQIDRRLKSPLTSSMFFKKGFAEQKEAWEAMNDGQLMQECFEYKQPVSDTREENMQNLFQLLEQVQNRQRQKANLEKLKQNINQESEASAIVQRSQQEMLAKYGRKQWASAQSAEAEEAQPDVTELQEELFLHTGQQALEKDHLIDVPLGPMRVLKPAPKYDPLTLVEQPGVKFEQLKTSGRRTNQKSAHFPYTRQYQSYFKAAQSQSRDPLEQMRQVSIKLNPNLQFKELVANVVGADFSVINFFSKPFNELLSFLSSAIKRLSTQNKAEVSLMLKQVDSRVRNAPLLFTQAPIKSIEQIAKVALATCTSLPNLLTLCKNENFLSSALVSPNPKNIVDTTGSSIIQLLKLAQQDFIKHRTDEAQYKEAIDGIQQKVEQLQGDMTSVVARKASLLTQQGQKDDPQTLLNRLVLLPTPHDGTRQEKMLADTVKDLIAADKEVENYQRGLFTPLERNYIFARGMQVQSDKELQNEIRSQASSTAGTGKHLTSDEALSLAYIVSGKLSEQSQFNSVYHLAGLVPVPQNPSGDYLSVKNTTDFARIDQQQVKAIRFNLKKQMFNCTSLKDLHTCLNFLEFQQKYAPLAIWQQNSKNLQEITNALKVQSSLFNFSLNDLVRIQNVTLVSMNNPTFLFDQILAHKDSFATAVEKPVLKVFIDDILSRMTQHEVIFDHLTNSTSLIHNEFVPYTKETFLVLSKLVSDLLIQTEGQGGSTAAKIPTENFALANKILSLEQVTTKVFDSSEQASAVLGRYLTQQKDLLQSSQTDQTRLSTAEAQIERLSTFDAIFKALRSVKPLVSNERELVETITRSVEITLDNLIRDINQFSSKSAEQLSQSMDVFSKEQFPLEQMIITNKSILDAISSLEEQRSRQIMNKYLDTLPLASIIDKTLLKHLAPRAEEDGPMNDQFVQSPRANTLIKEAIEHENWGRIERLSAPLITYFNQVLDAEVLAGERKAKFMELAESFVLKIRNSRSLFGVDLARFFKLVRQLQERRSEMQKDQGVFDELILNVSSNLRTLGVNLLYQVEEKSSDISIGTDSLFQGENVERVARDRQYKRMIFEMYKEVHERRPSLFSEGLSYGLSPLGVVFAELFDEMSFDEHMKCLEILGSHSIDNYIEELIKKLYDQYSQSHQIETLQRRDPDRFIQLAHLWPKFLQNNALITTLTRMNASEFSVEDQSRVLRITTDKNLVLPGFFQTHLNQLIRSTDRDQVKALLKSFLQSVAYVGFTQNINLEQITQVLRRIYKSPEQLDQDQLLNFLVTLAVSNSRYQDFDMKSKEFVERALDVIENQFTGTKRIKVANPNAKEDESFQPELELFLFNQIQSTKKHYNKILDRNTQAFESELARDSKREYFQQASNALTRKFRPDDEQDALAKEDHVTDFIGEQRNVPIDNDDDDVQVAGPSGQDKRVKRTYDRGSADSKTGFDEHHFVKVRNQKLAQLAKKDNHLLLYSNVNTLDFIDINANSMAKAWTILFHFRGKSTESMLYEEFNSIAQRNTISKTKNHEVFNKLFIRLSEECYKHNLQLHMAGSCELTGWPIDIRLSHFFFKKQESSARRPTQQEEPSEEGKEGSMANQMYAVYFLLQEEICYNSETRQEEALGLQKLMLRHLSQISNFKVCTVDENMTATQLDSAFAKIRDEFYPLLQSPHRRSRKASKQQQQQQQTPEKIDLRQLDASVAQGQGTSEGQGTEAQLSSLDDFVSESDDSDVDDIVDVPQSML